MSTALCAAFQNEKCSLRDRLQWHSTFASFLVYIVRYHHSVACTLFSPDIVPGTFVKTIKIAEKIKTIRTETTMTKTEINKQGNDDVHIVCVCSMATNR